MAKRPKPGPSGRKTPPPAKRKAPRSKAAAAAKPARTKTAAATGPLTLAEARALVAARRPAATAARRAAAGTAASKPSPRPVGAARAALAQTRDAAIAREIRDYTAMMTLMKDRGARAPGGRRRGPGAPAAATAAATGFRPLQILAEGDSWFDYPVPFFGGGIIPRLSERIGVPILNLAKAGDEVRFMMGVQDRRLLAEQLRDGCPAGGPWDVLLFSGGGNDIVDNPMALWVKDFDPGVPPEQLVNGPRFDAALALVRAGYEDLIEMRDRLTPGTHLIFHGYDFAIPDGRDVCGLFGPWLKPTFDLRGFPNRAAGQAVIRAMLQQFAVVLTALATRPKVTFINGQGTLAPQRSSWDNELHPSAKGFDKFADLFHATLRTLFPGRVA